MTLAYRDLALALLVVSVWGANFTVIQLGLQGFPPLLLAALRYVLALLPAVVFIARPATPNRFWIGYGLTSGVGQFGCLFYAMHIGMPAGVASVVLQSQAFFTILLAAPVLGERITARQLVGMLVAGVGLYLVGASADAHRLVAIPLPAFVFTMVGALFWGISNLIIRLASADARAHDRDLNMLSLVVWSSAIPPIPLLALSMTLNGPGAMSVATVSWSWMTVFAGCYLAYGATLFAFGTWSRLLADYPAAKIAPLSLLVPVTGLLTARVVLDEVLTPEQWIGCILIMTGLILSMLRRRARPASITDESSNATH